MILPDSIIFSLAESEDAKAEAPILQPPDVKDWFIGKDTDAGKDWRQEKGMTEDEMVGWHHRLNGHEFAQALRVGDGQRSLACCNPWGCKESDTTEKWTELRVCGNHLHATDVISTGSLPGDSRALQYCSKHSESGSHNSVKKTGVCASPSLFITELLIQVLLGKHPTVERQALSSHSWSAAPCLLSKVSQFVGQRLSCSLWTHLAPWGWEWPCRATVTS